jgi:hypothetical protein
MATYIAFEIVALALHAGAFLALVSAIKNAPLMEDLEVAPAHRLIGRRD